MLTTLHIGVILAVLVPGTHLQQGVVRKVVTQNLDLIVLIRHREVEAQANQAIRLRDQALHLDQHHLVQVVLRVQVVQRVQVLKVNVTRQTK